MLTWIFLSACISDPSQSERNQYPQQANMPFITLLTQFGLPIIKKMLITNCIFNLVDLWAVGYMWCNDHLPYHLPADGEHHIAAELFMYVGTSYAGGHLQHSKSDSTALGIKAKGTIGGLAQGITCTRPARHLHIPNPSPWQATRAPTQSPGTITWLSLFQSSFPSTSPLVPDILCHYRQLGSQGAASSPAIWSSPYTGVGSHFTLGAYTRMICKKCWKSMFYKVIQKCPIFSTCMLYCVEKAHELLF